MTYRLVGGGPQESLEAVKHWTVHCAVAGLAEVWLVVVVWRPLSVGLVILRQSLHHSVQADCGWYNSWSFS